MKSMATAASTAHLGKIRSTIFRKESKPKYGFKNAVPQKSESNNLKLSLKFCYNISYSRSTMEQLPKMTYFVSVNHINQYHLKLFLKVCYNISYSKSTMGLNHKTTYFVPILYSQITSNSVQSIATVYRSPEIRWNFDFRHHILIQTITKEIINWVSIFVKYFNLGSTKWCSTENALQSII